MNQGEVSIAAGQHRAARGVGWLDDLRAGAGLLTRLPLRADVPWVPGRVYRAFPVIGAGIGVAAALAYWLSTAVGLPPVVAALLTVAAALTLTGGLHEDGLADVADGFGGGATRAEKLVVMRDSRLGAYGALALIVAVGLRVAALSTLAAPEAVAMVLVAAGAVSRAAFAPLALLMSPARAEGLGHGAGVPDRTAAATAIAVGAGTALITLGLAAGLLALAVAAAAVIGVAGLARRQVGGYTGDVMGALQQAVEVAVLLAVVVVA
jgi:adenosylcobinamide-GDP ribazoletransferase